jgi:formate/nitrite transporter FocA (FNT family)
MSASAKEREEEQVEDRVSPPGEIVYEAIYREGQHELKRPSRALAWSGIAAGLSMGFSFVAEAQLRQHLPEAPWTQTVTKLGYSIGFLIVILGRQQLFTKNTLTVILPLLNRRGQSHLKDVARLWVIVFFANLLGALLFAWMLSHSGAFNGDTRAAFDRIGSEMPSGSFVSIALRAVLAGWLIALMIWLLPFAETARVWVITVLAYLVGLGHFPHIVAGAVPAFYLVLSGQKTLADCLAGFVAPTFLGNIVGGVAVVAALAHAELSPTSESSRRPAHRTKAGTAAAAR